MGLAISALIGLWVGVASIVIGDAACSLMNNRVRTVRFWMGAALLTAWLAGCIYFGVRLLP